MEGEIQKGFKKSIFVVIPFPIQETGLTLEQLSKHVQFHNFLSALMPLREETALGNSERSSSCAIKLLDAIK
jgi:hypothetical protein